MSSRPQKLLLGIVAIGIIFSVLVCYVKYISTSSFQVIVDESRIIPATSALTAIGSDTLGCDWDEAPYLFVSDNVFSPLIYYSHVFPMFAAALLAIIIIRQHGKDLVNRLFLLLAATFICWCLFDLILWADANPGNIMFFWSIQIFADVLIYLTALYLLYSYVKKRDIPYAYTFIGSLALVPLIVAAPTELNLQAFDYTNCDREALEGSLWHYAYLVEIVIILIMGVFTLRESLRVTSRTERSQIVMLGLGLFSFLLAFSWGNIVGSFSEDWTIAQYGLFGMPIFLGIVTYLIVRFQAFRIGMLATTAIVFSLWVLLFSVLLLETMESAKPIISITLIFFAVMGALLVRSVHKEIEQRELIEKQEKELQVVNTQQESLLHFISHEVKGFLSEGQSAFAAIVEGDFGEVPPKVKELSQTALTKMRHGVSTVMDILDASNLKRGSIMYTKTTFDISRLIESVIGNLRERAAAKRISISYEAAPGEHVYIGDAAKIERHVIRNLIDNAIRYTPSGSIHVRLVRENAHYRIDIADTGIGITPEDMAILFTEGGHGKDSIKINVDSTGFGLYVAKVVVLAHGGRIWAESEGKGKGSRFIVELPITSP